MPNNMPYVATNMTVGLMYKELKLTSQMIQQGLTLKEIRQKSYEDNIYQARSENFKKTVTSILLTRIKTLDDNLINMLSNANIDLEKQIAIYSVMKSDRLFFEFMREVYAEKIKNKENKIYSKDIEEFMQRKREQDPKVESWKNTTTNRLRSSYVGMLYDSNFAKKNKDYIEIIVPIIDSKLETYLKEINEKYYLDAMTGEY